VATWRALFKELIPLPTHMWDIRATGWLISLKPDSFPPWAVLWPHKSKYDHFII